MLTQLRLENFKSWRDTGEIPLKPITGFFGTNSSGKSSLFQALLLMKQTAESPDRGIVLHFGDERTLVDMGDFESVIHKHNTESTLKVSLHWGAKMDIVIPESYGGGGVYEEDEISFQVGIYENISDPGRPLILDEMSYRLPDGRQFGLQLMPNEMEYILSRHGSDLEVQHSIVRPSHVNRSKFHDFPYWVEEHVLDSDFSFDLRYSLTAFLQDLYYLGPLRASPHRIYRGSGAQPPDMGSAGESVVDAILSSRDQGQRMRSKTNARLVTIDIYVSEWLRKLGMAHAFRVDALAEGRRIFEITVRKSPRSAEVLLTDIGFGVSQVLPVLVLCFYVPRKSTVILEQPEIHLHPSAQAELADVFIDAWEKNNTQILFESHSEHLLRRLQRRIAEGEIKQEDVGLYFCSMEDNGESRLSHLELDEYGNISNWPKDFFGDQFGEIAAMSEAALRRQIESD